jgi:TPR repeat protein
MRTFRVVSTIGLLGIALGLSPAILNRVGAPVLAPSAHAEGRLIPPANIPNAPKARRVAPNPAPAPAKPFDAFRSGTQALREGRTDQGVTALEYAAQQGIPGAMWKLGRIYADGDGVTKNQLRSFEYFRNLTRAHAYDPPGTAHARFVANAFVMLGHFYLTGIPDSEVKADPQIAHQMFRHAAAHFGDAEAQFQVGRMYLQAQGTPKDAIQAARWLRLAANKGHRGAQAMLGGMLFTGKDVSRQAAMGLFWLTVAKDGAKPDEKWIIDTYNSAFAQATEDERAVAFSYLVGWMRAKR